MLVTSLTPSLEDKVRFSYSTAGHVPNASGCYVLTSFDDSILYIGQSVNIGERFEQHLGNSEKREHTSCGKIFWFYYFLCLKRELNNIETGWINEFKLKEGCLPHFNKINPPM